MPELKTLGPTDVETLKLLLIVPDRTIFSDAAHMVVLPGEEGDLGILPGHMALFTNLRPGVIYVFSSEGRIRERYFVPGGLVKIDPTSCLVVAEEIVTIESIDAEEAGRRVENLVAERENLVENSRHFNQSNIRIETERARVNACEASAY